MPRDPTNYFVWSLSFSVSFVRQKVATASMVYTRKTTVSNATIECGEFCFDDSMNDWHLQFDNNTVERRLKGSDVAGSVGTRYVLAIGVVFMVLHVCITADQT